MNNDLIQERERTRIAKESAGRLDKQGIESFITQLNQVKDNHLLLSNLSLENKIIHLTELYHDTDTLMGQLDHELQFIDNPGIEEGDPVEDLNLDLPKEELVAELFRQLFDFRQDYRVFGPSTIVQDSEFIEKHQEEFSFMEQLIQQINKDS